MDSLSHGQGIVRRSIVVVDAVLEMAVEVENMAVSIAVDWNTRAALETAMEGCRRDMSCPFFVFQMSWAVSDRTAPQFWHCG